MEKKPAEKMNRRDFARSLAALGGGVLLFAGFRGKHPTAALGGPSRGKAPAFVEGIDARIEGDAFHLDYRLSSKSAGRLKVPPAQATFIVAVDLASQRPIYFKPLAGAAGVTVTGPVAGKAGVSYHAVVKLAALLDLPKGDKVLVHAAFWQHRSGVHCFHVEA